MSKITNLPGLKHNIQKSLDLHASEVLRRQIFWGYLQLGNLGAVHEKQGPTGEDGNACSRWHGMMGLEEESDLQSYRDRPLVPFCFSWRSLWQEIRRTDACLLLDICAGVLRSRISSRCWGCMWSHREVNVVRFANPEKQPSEKEIRFYRTFEWINLIYNGILSWLTPTVVFLILFTKLSVSLVSLWSPEPSFLPFWMLIKHG